MTYGREFLGRYDGHDLVPIKQIWADALAGFADKPESIKYAIDNLPSDKAPNHLQFRDLCRKAPPKEFERLSYAPAKGDGYANFASAFSSHQDAKDHKAWAKRLKQREEDGEVLSQIQRDAWREALGIKKARAA